MCRFFGGIAVVTQVSLLPEADARERDLGHQGQHPGRFVFGTCIPMSFFSWMVHSMAVGANTQLGLMIGRFIRMRFVVGWLIQCRFLIG